MAHLEKAVGLGIPVSDLGNDPDLAPLRERADFNLLATGGETSSVTEK